MHIDSLWNIATVRLNGVDCGTLWTPPYSLNISSALKKGENIIEIEVTNTWRNKMVWEAKQPADKRTLWHNNPFSMENKPLLPAGIKGVSIIY